MRGHHRPKCAVTIPKSPVTMGRNTHCVGVSGLARGALIEIDFVARRAPPGPELVS
jgi:hypothetical protein